MTATRLKTFPESKCGNLEGDDIQMPLKLVPRKSHLWRCFLLPTRILSTPELTTWWKMVKSSKLVGLLYKAKCTTSCPQNLFLHYTMRLFIHILLTVYNLIWASTYVINLQHIHLLQKKVVWAISKADYKASSKPLFASLKILDLFVIYSVQKFFHVLTSQWCWISDSSRYPDFYRRHTCRTNIKKFSILFQGSRI